MARDKVVSIKMFVRDVRVESDDIGYSIGKLESHDGDFWYCDTDLMKSLQRSPIGSLDSVMSDLQEGLDEAGGAEGLMEKMIKEKG